ncbi:MAG: divalent-cation tolerance protein CutA [Acidobacteria bacterium]|nr:divalent-cation tolerance protein CutA [Acidobacteriota bacterium]
MVVLCNCGSLEEARKIAQGVVEKQLAACVNIVPGVHSIYRWQGSVEEASEFLLIIKTRDTVYTNLEEEIRRLHSYTVPEIIALPVERGFRAYLDWIGGETMQIQ